MFTSWSDVGYGIAAGGAIAGINSALDVGGSFLSDWFGDNNRESLSDIDLSSYAIKSDLDWKYYRDFYAPLNQRLQQEMFDYTSAGNYNNSIKYIGDSLSAQKRALSDNGYNPILAINGGAAVHAGNVTGSTGAGLTPHSASGVSAGLNNPNVHLGKFSIGEYLGAINSAAMADKTEAEAKQIKARTSSIVKKSELDEAKAALELQSLFKEVFPGEDVSPIDDQGARDFVRALRNKYQRDAYMNSIERQAVLDAVGVGTDAVNSAVGVKRAFSKSPKLLSTTKRGKSTIYEYGEP